MNHRKSYISPWVTLLLAAVAVLGCVLAAVGVSYARYRSGTEFDRIFSVRESGTVLLGKLDDADAFVRERNAWTEVDGVMVLDFAISNGTGAKSYSKVDQQAAIRVLAGPGIWDETLTLTVDGIGYVATPTEIQVGSALYRSFGEGRVLRFLDEQGNELTWSLKGDGWNTVQMQLSLAAELTDTSLLRLQVISEEAL